MILTGLAKKDFEKWYSSTDSVDIYKGDYSDNVFNTIRNALIIEWFDSVGICITTSKISRKHWMYDIAGHFISVFEDLQESRQEALNIAITKANEIYNTSN